MSLYQKVISELRADDVVRDYYRFQGANSLEHFDIRTSRFKEPGSDSYVYFSQALEHHKYFILKRIKQLLNQRVLQDTNYQLTQRSILDSNSYQAIRNLVINSDKIPDLYSIRLICDRNIHGLIKENSFMIDQKCQGKPLERVDRRVYGGGYGAAAEWKELLNYLTYFSAYQRIDRETLLRVLAKMQESGSLNKKENLSFIFNRLSHYNFELNDSLESDFTRYKIRNCLETILEKGIYCPASELGEHPKETIKRVTEEYRRGREKVLTLLDHYSSE